MKTTIKSIVTVTLALGIFGTPAFASGGRGTSVEIKTVSRMETSEPAGMGGVKNHSEKAAVNFGQPNR